MNTSVVSGEPPLVHLDIVRVSVLRPLKWLRLGWRDMRTAISLSYGVLVMAMGWTLLVVLGSHPYFVAAAISGFLLVGPLMSAGLCEMSRRYSLGQTASFDESLEGFARNAPALYAFGAILAICAIVWFAVSALLLGTVFHVAAPNVRETLYIGFVDASNAAQVYAYVTVGGLMAAAVFAVSVVAIPLMIDRHATAAEAMRGSLKVVFSNIPAMLLWSLLILVLTIIGFATFLVGLMFTVPLLGHATWHAYKDLIAEELHK